jgi:hypothetical protein
MSRESIIPQMAKVDNIELSTLFWKSNLDHHLFN